MPKLVKKKQISKLYENFKLISEKSIKEKTAVRRIKLKEYPRSYRLDPEIMNILKNTLSRINKIAPKKISEAKLVKALIFLSKEIKDEEMIKALKEVW